MTLISTFTTRARLAARAWLVLLAVFALPATARAQREPWRIITPPQASIILARDGSLIGEVGRESRISVPLHALPEYVPQAFIAVEDHRFYQHDGVDVISIAGAIKDNILGARRGASTITQQLIGNMHPDVIDRSDMSLARKLREQQAAREMERRYSKAQILGAYLNQIHFGHGWYGIESAARHYFGRPASGLTLAEAATLAGVINGPAIYDPVRHPDRARDRRNLVLGLMAQQRYITRQQATAAQRTALRVAPYDGMAAPADYFVDVIQVQAVRTRVPIASGGYRIYTTLDPALQRAAVEALEDEASAFEERSGGRFPTRRDQGPGAPRYLQGAVVALDPVTGDVRALVGGRDHDASPFNRAVDGMRQPGSAFKPFVYAAALGAGFSPTALVSDTAIAIPLPNGSVYRPDNADNRFLGTMTLRDALAQSRNVVAVQVASAIGIDSVAAVARRAGVRTPIAPVPATAIGASAVQPLDFVAAFTAFANLGTPVEPRFIHRIEDASGRVVYTESVRGLPPAIDPRVAFVVRDMMRDVVERGTATAIRRYIPASVAVAGKTGTTNDNTDTWFVGITPDLVAGVWLGFDRPTPMGAAAGGTLAAPVFGRMLAAYAGRRFPEWVPPAGVIAGEADRLTGMLATETTPRERRYTEYWIEGTEPEPLRLDPLRLFASGVAGL